MYFILVTHTAVSENNQKKAGSHISTLGQVPYITSTMDGVPLKRTPDSGSRTSAGAAVFYTTVTLISVFFIFAMYYGVSKLRNYISSKREAGTPALNFNESDYSHYQCVEFSKHM